jgi:hypothetical protein
MAASRALAWALREAMAVIPTTMDTIILTDMASMPSTALGQATPTVVVATWPCSGSGPFMVGDGARSRFATERRAKGCGPNGRFPNSIGYDPAAAALRLFRRSTRARRRIGRRRRSAQLDDYPGEIADAQLSSARITALASIHAQPTIATAIAVR